MEKILGYFPHLPSHQQEQLAALLPFYQEWNSKINVVSRKDIDKLYIHHVLHSLSIAKVITFKPYTEILDIGTGGGFPGIPLAILFPESRFTLVDSIGKKIKVVDEAIKALGLKNVVAKKSRAQDLPDNIFDFIVSRGVTKMDILQTWGKNLISPEYYNELPNGLLILKGGDLAEEMKKTKGKQTLYPIRDFFSEEWFETKYVVYQGMS